jgi:hypothetical protein
MNGTDLDDIKRRFLALANEKGIEAAEQECFAALPPLHPKTRALRGALLADLVRDDDGKWRYERGTSPGGSAR